ncbi:hypothetical protein Micbo1qcDRAFT_167092, partial [Microdochium bolleyi]
MAARVLLSAASMWAVRPETLVLPARSFVTRVRNSALSDGISLLIVAHSLLTVCRNSTSIVLCRACWVSCSRFSLDWMSLLTKKYLTASRSLRLRPLEKPCRIFSSSFEIVATSRARARRFVSSGVLCGLCAFIDCSTSCDNLRSVVALASTLASGLCSSWICLSAAVTL